MSSRRGSQTTRARGWASSTALTISRPVMPGIGVVPGRVDVGEHDDVGADEGVGVLAPHLGDAVEAVGLEGDDHPPPSVAAVTGGGDVGGDLRRQVGVRVDERRPAVDAADLEAAGDAAEAAERADARLERARRGNRPWRWRRWR